MKSFRTHIANLIFDEMQEGVTPPKEWRLMSKLAKKDEWECYECSLLDKHYKTNSGFFWKLEKLDRDWRNRTK